MTTAFLGRSLEIVGAGEGTRWHVQAVRLDRGTGLRSCFEVHGGATVVYRTSTAQVQALPAAHHPDPADLIPPQDGLPAGEDGCE